MINGMSLNSTRVLDISNDPRTDALKTIGSRTTLPCVLALATTETHTYLPSTM